MQKLYSSYMITGLNQDRVLNSLRKKNIILYKIKKYSNKKMCVTIDMKDTKNFFAYFKDMCYNVRKIRDGGYIYPLYYFIKRIGVSVGIILFLLITIISSKIIISVDYVGSGSLFSEYAEQILYDNGVKPYSFFNKSVSVLSSEILAKTNKFSYVSVRKKGARLKVELVLANNKQEQIDEKLTEVIAPQDGILESVRTYRGTALLKDNDIVKKGDVIVSGIMTVREKVYETYVLANISMICEYNYEYIADTTNQSNVALVLAKNQLGDYFITGSNVICDKIEDKYSYKVSLFYRIKF